MRRPYEDRDISGKIRAEQRERDRILDELADREIEKQERRAECRELRKTITGSITIFLGLLFGAIGTMATWWPWLRDAFHWALGLLGQISRLGGS